MPTEYIGSQLETLIAYAAKIEQHLAAMTGIKQGIEQRKCNVDIIANLDAWVRCTGSKQESKDEYQIISAIKAIASAVNQSLQKPADDYSKMSTLAHRRIRRNFVETATEDGEPVIKNLVEYAIWKHMSDVSIKKSVNSCCESEEHE